MSIGSCCGCIPLKAGCYIIGYLSLVVTLCNTLPLVPLLFFRNFSQVFDYIRNISHQAANVLLSHYYADPRHFMASLKIGVGVTLAVMFVILMFILLLLIGLHQNKPGPVNAYLIFSSVTTILYIIGFIIMCFKRFNLLFFFVNLVGILIEIYFLFVIRCMKNKMRYSTGCVFEPVNPPSHTAEYSNPTTYFAPAGYPPNDNSVPAAYPGYSGPTYPPVYPGHQLPTSYTEPPQYSSKQ